MISRQKYYTTSVTMKVENLTKVYASASGKVVSLNNVTFSVVGSQSIWKWKIYLSKYGIGIVLG
jgi:hypothetical protein